MLLQLTNLIPITTLLTLVVCLNVKILDPITGNLSLLKEQSQLKLLIPLITLTGE